MVGFCRVRAFGSSVRAPKPSLRPEKQSAQRLAFQFCRHLIQLNVATLSHVRRQAGRAEAEAAAGHNQINNQKIISMRISSVFLASILLSCGLSVPLFAQSGYEVKGVVVDSEGPVIGATVMESGTQNGTSTHLDGD